MHLFSLTDFEQLNYDCWKAIKNACAEFHYHYTNIFDNLLEFAIDFSLKFTVSKSQNDS